MRRRFEFPTTNAPFVAAGCHAICASFKNGSFGGMRAPSLGFGLVTDTGPECKRREFWPGAMARRGKVIAAERAACYRVGMHEVTQILQGMSRGDPHLAEQLLPLVYDELRKLAAQKLAHDAPGQTLQATALVHEAYLRLAPKEAGEAEQQRWDSRGHFFAAAAEAMRRILLDRARDKRRIKRGGGLKRLQFDQFDVSIQDPPDDLLVLDEALGKLAEEEPVCAQLFKLRFFAGLTVSEAARTLGIPRRTAYRYWAFARAWLYEQLRE